MTDLRLHANENLWGPLGSAPADLWRYPEAQQGDLEQAIAARIGLRPEDVVLGNGSTELISLLILSLSDRGSPIATCGGSFIAYRALAQAAGRPLQLSAPRPGGGVDLPRLRQAVTPQTRLIFIANPDKPSGTILDRRALAGFIADLPPGPIVVLDEAYREYVQHHRYPGPTEVLGPRTVMLRTFSKAYGLAGLRCGYALCPPDISQRLRAISGPFRVGRPTREAAMRALRDRDGLHTVVTRTAAARVQLTERLRRAGLHVAESHASFVMVDLQRPAREATAALRAEGIQIRPLDADGRPTAVRVTVGRPGDQPRLVAALRRVCAGGASAGAPCQ